MRMAKKIAVGVTLLGIASLIVYLTTQYWLPGYRTDTPPKMSAATQPDIKEDQQRKVWVCPMHPEIMQDHPGACPICGMDLVHQKSSAGHDHGIHVDTASIQKLGVRLVAIKRMSIGQEIHTYGNVAIDGHATYNAHSKLDGWIKKSYIDSVGQQIKKGQVIYEIYSPDLIAEQKEYLRYLVRREQSLKTIETTAPSVENPYVAELLQELHRERAKLLYKDIGMDFVRQLEDSKQPIEVVKILASQGGVVTQINAREGSFVTPTPTLFSWTDVSRVWVNVFLYPDQAARVKSGDAVTIRSPDGHEVRANLSFLSPLAENGKINARAEIDNAGTHFHPGGFVDVIIHTSPRKVLALPRSSVIHTGEGELTILSRGDGHFLPVHIETGIESGDWVEVVDGLLEGAEVAVSGQFLLDAAASMHDATQRMQESHRHQ